MSPALSSSPDAAHFASRFSLDDNDYEELFRAWRDTDGNAKAAACRSETRDLGSRAAVGSCVICHLVSEDPWSSVVLSTCLEIRVDYGYTYN